MKKTNMIDCRDIIRLRFDLGLTHRQIASSTGVASGTVANVLKRVTEAGLGQWPLPKDLDETALRARLYPSGGANKAFQQQRPDWDEVIKGLKEPRGRRRARMTQRQLWVEYRDEVEAQGGVAYSYSRFCAKLKDLLLAEPAAAEMRFDYAPGQYAMSDFSGKTLSLRDKSGGVVDVEIFVAVLPYSNLIYAEAVLDQKINSWAMAHRRALEYFKGVPKCLIIDNLKSGVTRPDREEPHLNATFREFAQHYGLAILPARPCRPTDKGAAESAVRTVQSPPPPPCKFTFKSDPFLPPNNGPHCGTEGQLERSRSRTSPQDEPSHSFLCRYHPWLPFHRCPMRRSFYNQRGGQI